MAPPRKTIDELPEQGVYEAGNYLVVQDSGVTKKMAASLIVNQAGGPLTAHLSDAVDAHDASAISATDSGLGINGATVQAQLGQLATKADSNTSGLAAHIADTADAHDATAISATVSGTGVDAVTVQGQLGQLAALVTSVGEVVIDTVQPSDPGVELWYDPDEPSGPGASPFIPLYTDVKDWGAVGDGIADDTSAIQLAITNTPVGGTLTFPRGIYKTTGTITTGRINVAMPDDDGSYISYTGTGTAWICDTADHARVQLRLRRSTTGWDAGTDTTSAGLVLRNCNFMLVDVITKFFRTGVILRGDGAAGGVCHNGITLRQVVNCKTGLGFESIGGGWANQNRFFGQIMYGTGPSSFVGTRSIDLATAGNCNIFLGVSLEGVLQERSFVIANNYNAFIGCRFEGNVAGACEFTAASRRNMVIGGYGVLSPSTNIFADAGQGNLILGPNGINVDTATADSARGGLSVRATTGDPAAMSTGSKTLTRAEVMTSGRLLAYDAAGKEIDATAIVEIDGSSATRGIRFGYPGAPGTPNVGRIYTHNTSFLGIIGSLLWGTNNTHDLGIFGNSPRDICLGRNLRIGGAIDHDGATAGFFNATPIAKPAVTGSRGGNAALASLLTQLAALGLITDSSTA